VVKQYISITPGGRVDLIGYAGDEISKTIAIVSMEEKPFKITDITSEVKDKIKYNLKTKKKGKEYALEIKNRLTEKGSFQGNIQLKTTSERKPEIVIRVFGNLSEEVMVSPESISFGTIDTNSEAFKSLSLKKIITLKDMRGDDLTIKKIKSSKKWIVTEVEKSGKDYNVFVSLDKDELPKGRFEEKISIHTNYKKGKSIVIDIKAEVI
jgi:hypothetical protein